MLTVNGAHVASRGTGAVRYGEKMVRAENGRDR